MTVLEANALNPTLPGEQISLQTLPQEDTARSGGIVAIQLPEPVTLKPGTYWIGVDGHYVFTRTPATGQPAAWGTIGDFATLGPSAQLDLRFTLTGTVTSIATPEALVETFDELATSGGVTPEGAGTAADQPVHGIAQHADCLLRPV